MLADNWLSVGIFADMFTQWRVGMQGVYGLDYGALPVVMDLRGVPANERAAVFEDIRVMEIAALEKIRSKT